MKIDNSKIFVGNVKKVLYTEEIPHFTWEEITFGSLNFKTEEVKDNVVLIQVKTKNMGTQYVPVSYLQNGLLSLLSIKLAARNNTFLDKRFLSKHEIGANVEGLFVEELKPLYKSNGKTDLKDINDMQYLINEKVVGVTF